MCLPCRPAALILLCTEGENRKLPNHPGRNKIVRPGAAPSAERPARNSRFSACATGITTARSQVSGHAFTHAVQRKEKNNSLLPQARRAVQLSDI